MRNLVWLLALGHMGCGATLAGEAGSSIKKAAGFGDDAFCYPCAVGQFDRCVPWAMAQFRVPCFSPRERLEVEPEMTGYVIDERTSVVLPSWIAIVNSKLLELTGGQVMLERASGDEFRAHPSLPAKHLQLVHRDGRRLLFHAGSTIGFSADRMVVPHEPLPEEGEGVKLATARE
jgi:hypothetical protein